MKLAERFLKKISEAIITDKDICGVYSNSQLLFKGSYEECEEWLRRNRRNGSEEWADSLHIVEGIKD